MNETKTLKVLGTDGKPGKDTIDLPGSIFDIQTNIPLIHQVVTAQQAAGRQGTHATKTRGEVRGGGIKPWRQKGTGRARQGSRRAPQWAGGGTVHGPQPRNYAQRTPKKMIAAALNGVLSDRAREDRIFVLDQIVSSEAPSTKTAAATLAAIGDYRRLLVVLDRDDFNGWLSVRNLPGVHVIAVDQLNAADAVVADAIVFSKAALEQFVAAPQTRGAVDAELVAALTEVAEAIDEADEAADSEDADKAEESDTKEDEK
jgi:large subunit ribosomal protein L4